MRVAIPVLGAAVVLAALLLARPPAPPPVRPRPPPRTSSDDLVVAVVQISSRMGAVAENRRRLAERIREAAAIGARIVVLPETAVHGYMEPDESAFWAAPDFPRDDLERSLEGVAETIPGESTRFFGELAGELSIHVLVPLIEVDAATGRYYNSAALVAPDGRIALAYRKANPWTVAEYGWATPGDGEPAVVDTAWGRVGVMICFDVHRMTRRLADAGAKLILWPVWWVDHDPALWFEGRLPALCRQEGVAIAAANRAATGVPGELPGAGFSRVVDAAGEVLCGASDGVEGNVYARFTRP